MVDDLNAVQRVEDGSEGEDEAKDDEKGGKASRHLARCEDAHSAEGYQEEWREE